jgi:predicted MPP superfamily phosphohydrolase
MALMTNDEITAAGWIDGYGQACNHLYVNRGIGFSVVPVRIDCLPEVIIFIPQSAD